MPALKSRKEKRRKEKEEWVAFMPVFNPITAIRATFAFVGITGGTFFSWSIFKNRTILEQQQKQQQQKLITNGPTDATPTHNTNPSLILQQMGINHNQKQKLETSQNQNQNHQNQNHQNQNQNQNQNQKVDVDGVRQPQQETYEGYWKNMQKKYEDNYYDAVKRGDVDEANKFSRLIIDAKKKTGP